DRVGEDLAELRDRLTRSRLSSAAEGPTAGGIVEFRRSWWDGDTWRPALVARVSTGVRDPRCRLVELGGQVVALPASGWRSRRVIRRLRRGATVGPGLLALARRGPGAPSFNPPRV